MISPQDFSIDNQSLTFKEDEYPLAKINRVRVKTNTIKDHLARLLVIGLLVSSIVWAICPAGFGQLTGPFSLIVGMLAALLTIRKYELQIEFKHIDETGLQWVSVAKANNAKAKRLFDEQARFLAQNLS